jgi:hypothetical protein
VKKATVLLLDGSAAASIPLLRELSEQGMLHDFVVVDPDHKAFSVESGVISEVSMLSFLATRALQLVRLVRLSFDGRDVSSEDLDLTRRLEASLTPVGIQMETTSVVLPLDGQMVQEGAFPQYWNYNLLVHPVDMAGEAGFAIEPLTDSAKQITIATAFVALVGALWKWLDEGPLDGGSFRSSEGSTAIAHDAGVLGARVRVVRATTRMVDAGDVAAQAVAWALAPGVQFPPPPGCVRHGEPRQAVQALASQLVPSTGDSTFGFTFRRFIEPKGPGRQNMSPLQAVILYLKSFWTELSKLPGEEVRRQIERLKKTVEDSIQNHTFGEDSSIKVSFSAPQRAEIALEASYRSEAVAGLYDIAPYNPPATPSVWSGFVATVLSLVDGGDTPPEFKVAAVQWANQRAVITDFGAIAHPTLANADGGAFVLTESDQEALGWVPGEAVVRGVDAFGAEALRLRIDSIKAAAGNTAGSAPEGPAAESSDENAGGNVVDAQKLRERLKKWVDERQSSLFWKVSEGLARQQQLALEDLSGTTDALESLRSEIANVEERETKSRRKFLRRAILVLIALFALIGAVVVSVLLALFSLVWIVVGAVVGLVGLLDAMRRTARERVQLKFHQRELISRPQVLMQRRTNAAHEFLRLSSLYQQYLDWAEIAAVAVHRPLGHIARRSEEPWATTSEALSFVSGVPSLDSERVRSATLSVLQHIARKGWLLRAYTSQRAMIVGDYERLAGGVQAADLTPESDNTDATSPIALLPGGDFREDVVLYAPRANLKRRHLEGGAANTYRTQLVRDLQGAVFADDQFGMITSVSCDIIGLNRPPRDARRFLNPVVEWTGVPPLTSLLSPRLLMRRPELKSIVGASDGLDPDLIASRVGETPVLPIPGRLTLAAFRLDVSDPIDLAEVEIVVRSEEPAIAEALPEPDDGPVFG